MSNKKKDVYATKQKANGGISHMTPMATLYDETAFDSSWPLWMMLLATVALVAWWWAEVVYVHPAQPRRSPQEAVVHRETKGEEMK